MAEELVATTAGAESLEIECSSSHRSVIAKVAVVLVDAAEELGLSTRATRVTLIETDSLQELQPNLNQIALSSI